MITYMKFGTHGTSLSSPTMTNGISASEELVVESPDCPHVIQCNHSSLYPPPKKKKKTSPIPTVR